MLERIKRHHDRLAGHAEYQKHISATTDAESVTGLLDYDTFMAADILRREALLAGDAAFANQQLTVDIAEAIEKIIGRPVDLVARKAREAESEETHAHIREVMGVAPSPPRPRN